MKKYMRVWDMWVVTLDRGDKDVPNGTIPLPELLLEITARIL